MPQNFFYKIYNALVQFAKKKSSKHSTASHQSPNIYMAKKYMNQHVRELISTQNM